jgi:hypothetical protein
VASTSRPGPGWAPWLAYFAALGAGFMLLEVAVLQRFVLLLGHPVYSLTVTLFSLLLGTGLGSLLSRRVAGEHVQRTTVRALIAIVVATVVAVFALPAVIDIAIPASLEVRMVAAVALLMPLGILLGMALPGGIRVLSTDRQDIVAWAWGINGAFSVVGATLAVFIAMNWGFSVTLLAGALVYAGAAATLATR